MLYELAASTYYYILPYIGLRSLNQSLKIFFRRNTAGRPGIGILLVCKLPNSVYEKSPTSINAILVGTGEQFITLFDDKMLMMHDELTTLGVSCMYQLYITFFYSVDTNLYLGSP